MKFQAVAIAVLLNIRASIAEDTSPAPCCSDFDSECYSVSNNRSNSNACDKNNACMYACNNEDSEACKACCVTFPQHETPWNCPAQGVSCLAEQYGVGNYSEYYTNLIVCEPTDGDASFAYELGNKDTVEQCVSSCEATGVPGCCTFEERVQGNLTKIHNCFFVSSPGNTLAELLAANGTEPVIVRHRRLIEVEPTTHFYRGIRCDAVPSTSPPEPETDSPSTNEPTAPGSDGGSNELRISLVVTLTVVVGALTSM